MQYLLIYKESRYHLLVFTADIPTLDSTPTSDVKSDHYYTMIYWPSTVMILDHRLRRWASIMSVLGQCFLFFGIYTEY